MEGEELCQQKDPEGVSPGSLLVGDITQSALDGCKMCYTCKRGQTLLVCAEQICSGPFEREPLKRRERQCHLVRWQKVSTE